MAALPRLTICLLLTFLASCSTRQVGSPVLSTPPSPNPATVRPLSTGHADLLWIPQAASNLTTPAALGFAAARESFWNRKPGEASRGFAALLESAAPRPAPSTNQLRNLVLQSHEALGDWAGSLAWYSLPGMEGASPYRRRFARTISAFPARSLEWENQPTPIPFSLHRDHLVIVNARMQGQPVRLLVDTGFTLSFVIDRFAASNGVQVTREAIRISDSNSADSHGLLARLDLLELGPLTVRNLPVVTAPPRLLQKLAGPIDGVIGWDLLRELEVTWDFPSKQLLLRPPPFESPPGEPNLSGCELPILHVTGPSGYPLNLFFDSGLASHRIQLDLNADVLASRLDLRPFRRSLRPQASFGMHSFRLTWPRRAESFAFHADGYRFELPGAVLSRSLHVREGLVAIDGTVGNAPFLAGRLTLDATHRRFHWEASP